MSNIIEQKARTHLLIFDQEIISEISPAAFEHGYWHNQDLVIGQETGRGTTLFLKYHNQTTRQTSELVLRHYLRGGLVSKLSKDKYWFRNWQKTRAIAEFKILEHLRSIKLPVPKPVAALSTRHGAYYSSDIIIERIPEAHDLLKELKQTRQSREFYQKLAKEVAEFHKRGVYHSDLNIQNILVDQAGKFWLIDFDRAKILAANKQWQMKTIKRLKRSFEKEKLRHDIQWEEQDWHPFITAYQEAMSH